MCFYGWEDITNYSFLRKIFAAVLVCAFSVSFFNNGINVYAQENTSINSESTFSMTDETSYEIGSSSDNSQFVINDSSPTSSVWIFVRMVLVLALVVGIIFLVFKFLKKSNIVPDSDDQFLRKVASISIAPGKSVTIVTLVDEAYILGVSDNSVNLISKVEDKELIQAMNLYADKNANVKKPMNFGEILNLFMGKPKTSGSTGEEGKTVYDGSTEEVLSMLQNQGQRLNLKEEE